MRSWAVKAAALCRQREVRASFSTAQGLEMHCIMLTKYPWASGMSADGCYGYCHWYPESMIHMVR